MPKPDYEVVEELLKKQALTPQQMHQMTQIAFSRLLKILPSQYNKIPILRDVPYSAHKGERLFADMSRGRLNIIIDHGYWWRYYNIYSYDRDLLSEVSRDQRTSMLRESKKRMEIADWLARVIKKKVCAAFHLSKKELSELFFIAVHGSTIRNTAKPDDDIDGIIMFREKFFTSADNKEARLRKIVYSTILKAYKRHKIHISLQAIGAETFLNKVCMELVDVHIAFFFFLAQPVLGYEFFNKIDSMFRQTPAYKKIKKKIGYARGEPVTLDKVISDSNRIYETDKEHNQNTKRELENLKQEVKKLKKLFGK